MINITLTKLIVALVLMTHGVTLHYDANVGTDMPTDSAGYWTCQSRAFNTCNIYFNPAYENGNYSTTFTLHELADVEGFVAYGMPDDTYEAQVMADPEAALTALETTPSTSGSGSDTLAPVPSSMEQHNSQ